ncbi:MAG: sulfurtransferase [Nitriliruptoraceae bacterium]
MTSTTLPLPGHVVDGTWLQQHLGHHGLRILDATVILDPTSWEANSGRTGFDASHLPGATFADLIAELSDPAGDVDLPQGVHAYKLPTPEAFAAAISRHGVGDASTVVVYDTSAGMWAARLWWLLRYFGHEQVAVLDGGWDRWVQEGRPVTSETTTVEPATFTARVRPELLATKAEVEASLGDEATVLVNALWPESFRGEAATPLPRPGRIPGSVNVPFTTTIDDAGGVRTPEQLRALFAEAGATPDKRVVAYCGGGIAAAADVLALAVAGVDAALYDGSLVEWVADPEAPLEVG